MPGKCALHGSLIAKGQKLSGTLSVPSAGSGDYNHLENKPSINGVTLENDKSFEELGVETMRNSEILEIFNRVFGG